MKAFSVAVMYVGFFALIGFSIYYTGRLMPLWALLLIPTVGWRKNSGGIQ